jgi:hypothetical protein
MLDADFSCIPAAYCVKFSQDGLLDARKKHAAVSMESLATCAPMSSESFEDLDFDMLSSSSDDDFDSADIDDVTCSEPSTLKLDSTAEAPNVGNSHQQVEACVRGTSLTHAGTGALRRIARVYDFSQIYPLE